jgi:carbon monoxide dehydrogenase subunit G
VNGTTTVALAEDRAGDGTTSMSVHAEISVLGRLGDFGQPVMERKATQILTEFAGNVSNALRAA